MISLMCEIYKKKKKSGQMNKDKKTETVMDEENKQALPK